MKLSGVMLLMIFYCELFVYRITAQASGRPSVVNIGALLSFSTNVGKVAKLAIKAAVDDVNSDPTTLGGTKLKLQMQDCNHSGFLALAEALHLMEGQTVAIIGPQDAVTSHVVSHVANELQVPLLSFSATDPTLSSLQFPYFVRTTQSDQYQMAAIAEIVDHYGWREVIAIYVDDDHGRNGIAALGDKLAAKRCRISFKAPLSVEATEDEITDLLVKVALTESRIIVVHTHYNRGPVVFHVAQYLGMLGTGYVWIATSWLSTALDTNSPFPSDVMDDIQGVLTLRTYTPDSVLKRKFISRWRNLTDAKTPNGYIGLNAYGFYAYDTVWLLARAINSFFKQGGNLSFSKDSRLSEIQGHLRLDSLRIFNGGNLLRDSILQANMTGTAGPARFNSHGDLINPAYEIINVIGTGYRRIGYWSNYSGLSVVPPETLYSKPPNRSSSNQRLYSVIWPGQTTQKPRGWVFPNNGRHLRIGVPNRVSFREFVSVKGSDMTSGFCIDVFTAAINLLPYAVPYKLIPFGDGHNNPSCTELVRLITAGVYDAAVGDIAIITNRTKMADFTQPYIESGLVVVAPVRKLDSNAWAFLSPFTPMMWGVTAVFFLAVGAVVWILEHRLNDEFRGPPLNSPEEYAKALKDGPHKGGVAAVVDDRAYAELFLSTRCEFSIVGQVFTKNGWGFAFPRDSPLAVDISTAILKLSENGDLQRIHDKWLLRSACSSQGAKLDVDRLQLKSFSGLYLLCGLACLLALFIYLMQIMHQFSRHYPGDTESNGGRSRSARRSEDEMSSCNSNRKHIELSSNLSLDSDIGNCNGSS